MANRESQYPIHFPEFDAEIVEFDDPLIDSLVETAAFRRLRHIHFLGAIDYLVVPTPNGAAGNIRHTRYKHSLEVARLCNSLCLKHDIPKKTSRLLNISALLHDIGHAPLSHSLEPVFKNLFGIDHHIATKEIICGQSPLGRDVYDLLSRSDVEFDLIIGLLEGQSELPLSEFFSDPINFDTIEGITRTRSYTSTEPNLPHPMHISDAARKRETEADRRIVDRFWTLKDEMYVNLINSPTGYLADLVSQFFMRRNIENFSRADFFGTEIQLFRKIPGLKTILTNELFPEIALSYIPDPPPRRVRRFFVDDSVSFKARHDKSRYRQRKVLTKFELRVQSRRPKPLWREGRSVDALDSARTYSESKISKLRERMREICPLSVGVITCGSYARREAADVSDLDYFVVDKPLADDPPFGDTEEAKEAIEDAIAEIVPVEPSDTGAFGRVIKFDDLVSNIGGEQDTNHNFTRRVLLLLESEWIANNSVRTTVIRTLLERYIGEHISDHNISLFLLNDIIRYYRTIAVDYEFKTSEHEEPKPWGTRNIKLVFSRKLIYISGVFSVAETANQTRNEKIKTLETLFAQPPLDRMTSICGEIETNRLKQIYSNFLQLINDRETRAILNNIKPDERNTNMTFRNLKNEGHRFSRELIRLFDSTFDPTHPIRKGILL